MGGDLHKSMLRPNVLINGFNQLLFSQMFMFMGVGGIGPIGKVPLVKKTVEIQESEEEKKPLVLFETIDAGYADQLDAPDAVLSASFVTGVIMKATESLLGRYVNSNIVLIVSGFFHAAVWFVSMYYFAFRGAGFYLMLTRQFPNEIKRYLSKRELLHPITSHAPFSSKNSIPFRNPSSFEAFYTISSVFDRSKDNASIRKDIEDLRAIAYLAQSVSKENENRKFLLNEAALFLVEMKRKPEKLVLYLQLMHFLLQHYDDLSKPQRSAIAIAQRLLNMEKISLSILEETIRQELAKLPEVLSTVRVDLSLESESKEKINTNEEVDEDKKEKIDSKRRGS